MAIRALSYVLILAFSFILQSSVMQRLAIFDVKPNTAVVIIVCLAFLRDDVEGAIIGFFAGLLQDVMFGRFIGFNALAYATVGYFCGKPFKDYFRENYIFPLLLSAASVFFYEAALYLTHFLLLGRTDTLFYTTKIILPSTVYTTLCVFPLYWLILKINAALEAFEKKRGSPRSG